MRFKKWIETTGTPVAPEGQLQRGISKGEKGEKIKDIWNDAFRSLGIDGLEKHDAATRPLSGITFSHSDENDPKSKSNTTGKSAVLKRLLNGGVIKSLKDTGDPDLKSNADSTVTWLGADKKDGNKIAAPTVSDLLKHLFGTDNFESLIGKNFPKKENNAKPQVPPQPPKGDGTLGPTPDGSMDQNTPQPDMQMGAPMGGGMNAQPQVAQGMQMPPPSNPMQPPAGAFMGLW